MRKYDSYKDSGVEWIGEVPSHWEVKKVSYFGYVTLGKMLTPEDKGGHIIKPYLRSQNIQNERVDVSDVKEMWFSESELDKLKLWKGDLLLNEGGDVGRTCMWDDELEECYIQNSVNRLRFFEDSQKYFLYLSVLYHSVGHYDSIVNRVSIPHLTKEKLESVRFLRPPLPEQQQIVSFLDTKTSQIDSLLEKTQRKIELLKEKRTSLINELVTKGLNPNVEMKDSGVEWIGGIPSHWELKQLKHISDFQNGYGFKSDKWTDSGIPIIRIQNLNGGENFNFYEEENELEKYLVSEGDLLFSWSGNIGTSFGPFMWDKKGRYYLNQHIFLFNQKVEVNLKWYFFTLKRLTKFIEEYFTSGVIGLVHITKDELGGSKIPYPPLFEQQQIVEYLDKQTQLIDKTISIEEKRIELLKEYRQSLISEVVTGKIDVRVN